MSSNSRAQQQPQSTLKASTLETVSFRAEVTQQSAGKWSQKPVPQIQPEAMLEVAPQTCVRVSKRLKTLIDQLPPQLKSNLEFHHISDAQSSEVFTHLLASGHSSPIFTSTELIRQLKLQKTFKLILLTKAEKVKFGQDGNLEDGRAIVSLGQGSLQQGRLNAATHAQSFTLADLQTESREAASRQNAQVILEAQTVELSQRLPQPVNESTPVSVEIHQKESRGDMQPRFEGDTPGDRTQSPRRGPIALKSTDGSPFGRQDQDSGFHSRFTAQSGRDFIVTRPIKKAG